MLEYDRIDASEGLEINKTGCSKAGLICQYYYFLRINFRFQTKISEGCHDTTQNSIIFDDVAITAVERRIIGFIFGV